MTFHDLFTLMILPIGTSGTIQIQYMKYISEYIPKLQIHQQLKYHFIRSVLYEELLKLEKIRTSQNPADMVTKGVIREKLSSCSVYVGLQS